MEIIRDLLWLWILGALGGSGYIVWALYLRGPQPAPARTAQQITTRRTPAAPPVARPAGQAPVAPRPVTPAVPPDQQRRGSAPTVKLPISDGGADKPARKPTGSDDDKAAAELFGGLAEAKAKADAAPPLDLPAKPQLATPRDVVEKAQRLEERGFHVPSTKVVMPGEAPPAPAAVPAATPAPAQARTQTEELDDILKRIDAVLSDSGAPASEATITHPEQTSAAQATMPLPQAAPDKHERKATDPNQQKLF